MTAPRCTIYTQNNWNACPLQCLTFIFCRKRLLLTFTKLKPLSWYCNFHFKLCKIEYWLILSVQKAESLPIPIQRHVHIPVSLIPTSICTVIYNLQHLCLCFHNFVSHTFISFFLCFCFFETNFYPPFLFFSCLIFVNLKLSFSFSYFLSIFFSRVRTVNFVFFLSLSVPKCAT